MGLVRIIVLIGLISVVAQVYAFSDGTWTYEINADLDTGSATITGCALKEEVSDMYGAFLNGNCPSEDLVIPASVDGYSVTEVGELAFYESDMIRSDDMVLSPGNKIRFTSVRLPTTLLRIGSGAFKNNSLTQLFIPDSVVTIGPDAFASNRLVNFTFPKNRIFLPDGIFENNALVNVVISDDIEAIGKSTFKDNLIVNIVWPPKLLEIGSGAFMNNRLTEIVIPESVGIVGGAAFANNLLETLVFLGTDITVIGSGAFAENDLKSVVLPSGIETIGYRAFFRNRLESVVIPDGVKSIDDSAFYINKLVELTLPDSVTTLGRSAFRDNMLTRVEIPASVTIMGSSVFQGNPLETVLFKGGRPSNVGNSLLNLGLNAGSTVAYCEGAEGWPGAAIDGIAPIADCDLDGITDAQDAFPRISIGNLTDTDGDGAPDTCDQACLDLGMSEDVCPATTSGSVVDSQGCVSSSDEDGDGYSDQFELDRGSNPRDPKEIPSALGLSPAVLKAIRRKSSTDNG